jgi:hypothetical protein
MHAPYSVVKLLEFNCKNADVTCCLNDRVAVAVVLLQARAQKLSDLSNHFYTLIPHDFGVGKASHARNAMSHMQRVVFHGSLARLFLGDEADREHGGAAVRGRFPSKLSVYP